MKKVCNNREGCGTNTETFEYFDNVILMAKGKTNTESIFLSKTDQLRGKVQTCNAGLDKRMLASVHSTDLTYMTNWRSKYELDDAVGYTPKISLLQRQLTLQVKINMSRR